MCWERRKIDGIADDERGTVWEVNEGKIKRLAVSAALNVGGWAGIRTLCVVA